MAFRSRIFLKSGALAVLALGLSSAPGRAQIGPTLSGIGPVNRSMGGASTAAPVDSLGALYWNPATISGLPKNEVEFGAEGIIPDTQISSTVPAGAAGPLGPPVTLSGEDRGDNGVFVLPSIGLVYRPEGSALTYGLGLYAVAGFAVNYPADPMNPILSAQPPRGLGLSNLAAELDILQIAPTVSYQVTDHLSVGFAPTIDVARLTADPATLVPPNPSGVPGIGVYPPATHTPWAWGLGAQAGVYYTTDSCWNFGASVKSPQWFQPFRYYSTDGAGNPRTLKFHFDYPMFVSTGVSYTGFERWVFATDFRFVDWHDTPGFSHFGFDSSGAATGLGWDSVFCVAAGAQYKLTDALTVRMGYTYNMNPIPDSRTAFNVASPTILEHTVYAGFSYNVTECFMLSLAYAHGFENSVQGPYITPLGTLPGASIKSEVSADTIMFGATVKF